MKLFASAVTAMALTCVSLPSHALSLFSGFDAGATSLATAPNATSAAASFDAALTGLTLLDFEGALGDFSFTPDATVDSRVRAANLFGANTTPGGANYLSATFDATFNFATPIDSFGAFFTGVQRADATLTYLDGTTTSLTLPAAGLSRGGIYFFGFSDPGASISSIDYFTGTGGDFVGLDDIRYGNAVAPIPLPAPIALLLAGMAALGAVRARRA